MKRLRVQIGYSLLELIMAIGISGFILSLAYVLLSQMIKSASIVESKISAQSAQLTVIEDLMDVCTTFNTVYHAANDVSWCINAGDCSSVRNKEIQVVDKFGNFKNKLEYTNKGETCKDESCDNVATVSIDMACSTKYADTCYEKQVDYMVKWSDQSKNILAPWKDLKVTSNLPKIYRSCQEARDNGELASGIYWLDTDGVGGDCPIEIYCEMYGDSGRALVINAPQEDYDSIPIVEPPVVPTGIGRLNNKLIETLALRSGNDKAVLKIDSNEDGEMYVNITLQDIVNGKMIQAEPTNCSQVNEVFEPVQTYSSQSLDWYLKSTSNLNPVGFYQEYGFRCQGCGATQCGGVTLQCCKDKVRGAAYVL